MTLPKSDSLELRIMELVRDHYPITKDELKRRLGVSEAKLDLALRRMVQQGLVEYDVLPDKVYIRLKVIPVGPKARKEHKRAKEKEERRRDGQDKKDDYSYM
jgi:DNA-binding MarR family transcriptional regulator